MAFHDPQALLAITSGQLFLKLIFCHCDHRGNFHERSTTACKLNLTILAPCGCLFFKQWVEVLQIQNQVARFAS
jgi:hypothetical protein